MGILSPNVTHQRSDARDAKQSMNNQNALSGDTGWNNQKPGVRSAACVRYTIGATCEWSKSSQA